MLTDSSCVTTSSGIFDSFIYSCALFSCCNYFYPTINYFYPTIFEYMSGHSCILLLLQLLLSSSYCHCLSYHMPCVYKCHIAVCLQLSHPTLNSSDKDTNYLCLTDYLHDNLFSKFLLEVYTNQILAFSEILVVQMLQNYLGNC